MNRSAYPGNNGLWQQGRELILGNTTAQDWRVAAALMEKAANLGLQSGNGQYAFELGRMHLTGFYYSDEDDTDGVPKCPKVPVDPDKANQWFERSAEAGHGAAKNWLTYSYSDAFELSEALYHFDWDGDPFYENADYPWSLAACDLGNGEACMDLVSNLRMREHYFSGNWPEKDPHRYRPMVVFYLKARRLGEAHFPVTESPAYNEEDAQCLQREAKAGYLPSQFEFGLHLAGRKGQFPPVYPDLERAYGWLCAALGCEDEGAVSQARKKTNFNHHLKEAGSIVWFLEQVLDQGEMSRAQGLAEKYSNSHSARKIGTVQRNRFWKARPWRI